MSTKPENSPEEAARNSANSTPPSKNSAKTAPTIDLPPEAVNRLEEAQETAASKTGDLTQKPRSPMLVPALCGLLAGLGGGAGVSQFMPVRGPAPQLEARLQAIEAKAANTAVSSSIADRLKAAETALADVNTREGALRGEIEQLARALRSEGETRAKGIASLVARPADMPGNAPSTASASSDLETLRSRLGAMDQTLRSLPEAIGAVGARSEAASGKVEAISPRIDQLSARIEQMQPRIGALSEQVSAIARTATSASKQDGLARATAFVTASAGLTELFRSRKPFETALAPLSALGAGADLLAPLQPFAKTGAPDGQALLADIKALRVKPAAAVPATPNTTSDMFDRLKAGAMAIIEVRRTGEITGTDDEAHLARVEQALQRGELPLASSLLDKLSADRKPVFAPFSDKLKARIAAEAGLEKLRLAAQFALSEAAQALVK